MHEKPSNEQSPIPERKRPKAATSRGRSDAAKKKRKLTKKQSAFVSHYVKHPEASATDSVIAAGYRTKNRDLAAKVGSQLLDNPRVKTRLQDLLHAGKFEEEIQRVWRDILGLDPENPPQGLSAKDVHDLKLKANQQLIRCQGLEAPRKSENRSLNVSIRDLIPKRD